MADDTPAPGKPCPVCGRPATATFRPFCSKRCANIDLGRWFTGSYRIPDTGPAAGGAPDEAGDETEA